MRLLPAPLLTFVAANLVRPLAWDLVSAALYSVCSFLKDTTLGDIHTRLRWAVNRTFPHTLPICAVCDVSILHGENTDLPQRCIYDYLSSHAKAHPTTVALQDIDGQQVTYNELQESSSRLAYRLHALGARRGTRVVLLVERSIPHIIAIFATLRLGAAYIPLDGALIPDTSLTNVINDAQPALVLVSKSHASRMVNREEPWFCIEDLLQTMTPSCSSDTEGASSCDPAYIIYTSGMVVGVVGVNSTYSHARS